jgi:hypothetical protein
MKPRPETLFSSPPLPTSWTGSGQRIHLREGVVYLIAFSLAVATVGGFLRWHIGSLYVQDVAPWRARETAVADDQAQRVGDWLKERCGDSQVFTGSSPVPAVLRRHYQTRQIQMHPQAGPPESPPALDEMAKWYSYAGVYFLDRDGHVVRQSSRSVPLNPLFLRPAGT